MRGFSMRGRRPGFLIDKEFMTNEEAIRIIKDYDKKHDCLVENICFCNPDFPEGVKACSDINIQTAYNCLRMSINERFEKQATKKNIRQMK
jgi:hypothetical protein